MMRKMFVKDLSDEDKEHIKIREKDVRGSIIISYLLTFLMIALFVIDAINHIDTFYLIVINIVLLLASVSFNYYKLFKVRVIIGVILTVNRLGVNLQDFVKQDKVDLEETHFVKVSWKNYLPYYVCINMLIVIGGSLSIASFFNHFNF
ncbi:TPA: hypothetical protein IYI04_003203 [Enterococcus faecium]|uniref:hypothetical protein n=1 Tax=Staphylococcus epidermidis TaxID=1282 RepID=UPI00070B7624|nr:hypothetical protein [Staphylococcus epidermidis]MCG2105220.1 hypothetical protein [Staphylococcus epidermidis]MCG2123544.1 hypothetical protein [Staphylococcus epidermidis]HBC2740218.1 hypothetical protein [Enterococcus faecium]